MLVPLSVLLTFAGVLHLAHGHIALIHPSMYGFDVDNGQDPRWPYDNRQVAPLMDRTFEQWWFHGHIDIPPAANESFELPAGKPATSELACNRGLTSFFATAPGGDIRAGNNPCTEYDQGGNLVFPSGAMHTTGPDDLKGCALAIAYESDPHKIQPEDFTVFSVNHTCVWSRFTDFQVPERMPECPPEGCHCAWFWIHSPDSGGEQNYMNAFRCHVTGSTSNVALAKPQLPRRCGKYPAENKLTAVPGNCTYGAKQPFYWFQKERNNMPEGTYAPPEYTDLYNFLDGSQDDIFQDSYPGGLPTPSPNSTVVPKPFLGNSPSTPKQEPAPSLPPGADVSSTSDPCPSASDAPNNSASTSDLPPSPSATSDAATTVQPPATTASDTSTSPAATSDIPSTVPSPATSSTTAPAATTSDTSTPVQPPTASDTSTSSSSTVTSNTPPPTTTASDTSIASVPSTATPDAPSTSAPSSATTSDSSTTAASSVVADSPPSTTSSSADTSSTQAMTTSSTSSQPDATESADPATGMPCKAGVKKRADASPPSRFITLTSVRLAPPVAGYTVDAKPTGASTTPSKRKVFRRRALSDVPVQARDENENERDGSEPTVKINVPGVRAHRKLQNRSRLWSLF